MVCRFTSSSDRTLSSPTSNNQVVKEARILSVQLKHSTVQASRLQVIRKSLTERFFTGLGRHVLHVYLNSAFKGSTTLVNRAAVLGVLRDLVFLAQPLR